jgi:hypothetical protein
MEVMPYQIDSINTFRIMLLLEHKANFQDSGKRYMRRNKVCLQICTMACVLEENLIIRFSLCIF